MHAARLFNCLLSSLVILSYAPRLVVSDATKFPPNESEWSGWGGNIYNNRWASQNTVVNSTTVSTLTQHCRLSYPGGVSATPVVLNNTVYYPTWNGSFVALNYATCAVQWQINVTAIILAYAPLSTLQQGAVISASRTSPQIDGNILYFGTQANALLVAVDLSTGATLGSIQLNPHPLAIVTVSPTLYKGTLYAGTSSQEEIASTIPGYKCCTFIGNFAAVTFDTKSKKFTIVWNVSTLPENDGWSGASVWGSQPPIDPSRNQIFIATGNVYEYPPALAHCANETASCLPSNIWQESVLAIDLPTGNVNWVRQLSSLDGWVMGCFSVPRSPLCPSVPGLDADFGMNPTFVPAALGSGTTGLDTVVIGQKSGSLYSLSAATGASQWSSVTSPGANEGGLSWGIAVDDQNIYFVGINYGKLEWPLLPAGTSNITNSAYGSASLKTGAIQWETAATHGQLSYAPPMVVGDIILASRAGDNVTGPGAIVAVSKTNGTILHEIPLDSVMRGGITVQDSYLFVGTGYDYENPFVNGSFYVMALPGTFFETPFGGDGINGTTTTPTVSGTAAKPSATKKGAASRMATSEGKVGLYLSFGGILFFLLSS